MSSKIFSRAKRFFHSHPILKAMYQVIIIFVSLVIIIGGIAMLILPGPGLLTMFAGLVLMSTEVPWAHRLVRIIKLKAKRMLIKLRRVWKNRSFVNRKPHAQALKPRHAYRFESSC